ncbi:MAG: peroxiredoxin [Bdellovibrionota bacterium]|nr:peroxiredoxin [Bdellovibrionota bacterium]
MSLLLGDLAPNFKMISQKGDIDFHQFIGDSWVFFFSHPADFTPVCTTEMGRTSQLALQFEKRNVKPLGLSTDSVVEHEKWIKDVNETQDTDLQFPILADTNHHVAKLYDMIHPGQSTSFTVRSVFIIDPEKRIRLSMTYPMSVGRNFNEILRVIDALQITDEYGVATPADWQKGERVIIPPTVSSEEAKKKFPQGFEEQKPYLRYTSIK